ncbi:hypothetical protein CHUAL_006609 [Chamberlinius hualienensis]
MSLTVVAHACKLVLVTFLIVNFYQPSVLAAGSCREARKCCPGRDSSCVVQKAPINAIIEDLSDEPCYCDHACLKLGDCCHDFKDACKVTDCEVTSWEPWSECDAECGPGVMTRSRFVIRDPANGGKPCSELVQKRGCHGNKCHHHQDKAGKETAMILPATLDFARTVNISRDIRKNLQLKYPKDPMKDNSHDYCVEFEVVKGSKGCHHEEVNKILHHNNKVCVMCSKTAMLKGLDYRCRGHGIHSHPTRYISMSTPSCHGRWIQLGIHNKCSCKEGANFIFV